MPLPLSMADAERTTSSGIPVQPVYTEADLPDDLEERLGAPGAFPFTRGIYPEMYRAQPWTMRQYAGFSTADESNKRYKLLLAAGARGLSVAFDLPTQIGYTPTTPPPRARSARSASRSARSTTCAGSSTASRLPRSRRA